MNRVMTKRLYLVAAVILTAGILFGYDQGVISGALRGIQSDFDLGTTMIEVITSFVTLGALVGANICDADRAALVADGADHALADGWRACATDLFRAQSNRDELDQVAILVHHTQGRVGSIRLLARQLGNALQNHLNG